jgi:multiple sugar transport system ATP-binding protein
MASVSIRGVTKHFGATTVIPGVDLQIADGEFVTLVGPSGCGKSTLLRMIAGLEGVSGGEIAIAGERVNETPPMHRDVAMVFQSYALYPHMDVERNMSFGLRLRHLAADVIAQKVEQAAGMLNLKTLLARLPSQLSGGQRQRVAMGRAMVRQPRVFLFDEPLSNLDAKLRVQMRTEIKALHKRLATTSIYVTHDQIEAMTMADRIVVMNAGRIEQVGTPEALYDAPDNLFVAGFIGSPAMNFLDGTAEGDGSIQTSGGARVPAPIRLASGRRVTLGIRPEHVRLAAAGEPGAMHAEVISVEPTGADTHVVCNVGAATITVSVRDRVKAEAGQTVPIAFDAHEVHCFDPESGASLRR